ncbi:PhzF family phenazine biosynthesis protein [Alicyclobacillus sp. SO9]|uniref:PhzF family phenazine biosynthesis protein n=1 Tax=Alicyclobacillus sp. SO9 TaxID=2665646 RepID=UPI0018E8E42C|nr:PhzF family phenazine biosynthesis protein [Alicyclobacillus sp. SO9]QQE77168.1 PhzF family phenazine biosynthesis protein [Alicyclobacillus sp. SO9]
MRQIEVFQVDAFTTAPFSGNPAGVVLSANDLTPLQMQHIARELNCSETAFVIQDDIGNLRFRYFTPATEVDLCGHATVATLHLLHSERNRTGLLRVGTNVGELTMQISVDGTVWMNQAAPKFQRVNDISLKDMAQLLGIDPSAISSEVPFGLAYTGLWDFMVPVTGLDVLEHLQPNFDAIKKLNEQQGAASTHVYTFSTKERDSTLHARDFSPAVGILEDPHTGTASGALGAWLVDQGKLEPGEFVFEQGWSVGRPGFIHVAVSKMQNQMQVKVGGKAATVLKGLMTI